MPLLRNRAQVAVALEPTAGTAEPLAAANVILAYDPDFKPNIEAVERDPVRSVFSPMPSLMGKRSASMSFAADLMGTGSAGDAVHISAPL